jgi:hypothetical protein
LFYHFAAPVEAKVPYKRKSLMTASLDRQPKAFRDAAATGKYPQRVLITTNDRKVIEGTRTDSRETHTGVIHRLVIADVRTRYEIEINTGTGSIMIDELEEYRELVF